MLHLGDITKIKGCTAPTVDCIIGGSPCQDLSLAGKRAGLAGARSGLYMEQIRIIKEMRYADVQRGNTDVDVRPRYMVWENVPGAFSTNGGKDFAAVLEEAIRVAEPEAPDVPVPEKGWPTSGCLMGDSWSVAWRVLDAQFWGTSDKPLPQRRRRIALVADFGGLSAPEILFVRESVSGNLEPSEPKRKETARDAGECTCGAVPCTLKIRGGCSGGGKGALIQENKSATLSTLQDQTLFQPVMSLQGSMIGRADQNGPQGDGVNEDVSFTLNTTDRHAVVYGIGSYHSNAMKSDNPNSGIYEADTSKTLDALNCGYPGCNQGGMAVVQPIAYSINHQGGNVEQIIEGVTGTLTAATNSSGNNKLSVAYSLEHHPQDSRINIDESGMVQTLTSRMGTGGGNVPMVMESIAYNGANITDMVLDDQGGSQISVRKDGKSPTLRAETHGNLPCVLSMESHAFEMQAFGQYKESGNASSLKARDHKDATDLVVQSPIYTLDRETFNCGQNFARNLGISDDGIVPTLKAVGPGAVAQTVKVKHIVRRLTPLECERLQGFPDGWTDIGEWVDSNGKKHKEADSPRYKALGNSIAIPPWKWVLKRLCACYERDATMASLFDGIGGFPLIWEQLNGKGSCLWASEIEEFPMAVTKLRFGGHNQ